ncbi:MAG: hypothetical protein QW761_00960, partial [Candidatus Aenigmatarchaeota archaeon]
NENMRLGYTFEQALFDDKVGAIWNYPSKLIASIMRTILEASRKSLAAAADSMMTISQYLKGIHEVKEDIAEILGETTSSMRFLAMFLAPMVAGVTVTMAMVILKILSSIGAQLSQLVVSGEGMTPMQNLLFFGPGMLGGTLPITASGFQMIVGLYMFETAVLISVFLNRIEYGEDVIGERNTMAKILIVAIIVYVLAWYITYTMFGGTLESLLTPTV